MKAFLCAAGKGTRISKAFPVQSKCTLDVGGVPLIRHTAVMLLEQGIEVTVIVGYRQQDVRAALEGLPVCFVYNPFFDVTNSIASLWMARSKLAGEDTIIANADVYWNRDILELLLADPEESILLADHTRADDGDFFLREEAGRLLAYGKDLAREERNCEYVGIGFLRSDFVPSFLARMEQLVSAQQHDLWWENVLYSMQDERIIHIRDVRGCFWAEVDFIEDYQRILEHVRAEKRAGGPRPETGS